MEENIELKQEDNKKKVIIGSILLVLLGIVGFLVIKSNTNVLQALEQEVTIELGEDFSYDIDTYIDLSTLEDTVKKNVLENALLEISDYETITIISNEEEKEVPVIGQYSVTITYEKEVVEVTVIVEDTTSPVFEEIEEEFLSLEIVQDETFDESLLENYIATDLREVTVTYDDSEVDYTAVGEYTLQVIATDESGNETILEVAISVVAGEIEIDKEEITLTEEGTYTLEPIFTGTLSDEDIYSFESEDKDTATVSDEGEITAKSEGTTTIVISIKEVEKEVKVIVEEKATSSSSSSSSSSGSSSSSSSSSSSNSGSSSSSSSNNSSNSSSDEEEHSDAYLQYMEELEELTTPHISMEALDIINDYRVAAGLSKMTYDNTLEGYALQRVVDVQTDFSHDIAYQNRLDGTWPSNVGEVLASVGSSNSYASYVVEGWKGSSAHWNWLMDSDCYSAAVAYMNGKWVCVMFYDQG